MGVVRTVVHVHVLNEATADTVLGEHTLHNVHEQGVHTLFLIVLLERFLHEHFGSGLALTAGIAGVAEIYTVGHLLAGENNLVGVDDDYIVAALHVGGVAGFVFAAKQFCHFGAKTAKNLVGGVDYHPLVLNLLSIGEFGAIANGIPSLIS